MNTYQAISVSRGVDVGPVYQFHHVCLDFETTTVADAAAEVSRYDHAVEETVERLERIYDKAVAEIGTDEAAIFHAHIMILQDPDVTDEVRAIIRDEKLNAEAALFRVTDGFIATLDEIDDEYIRQRIADIKDVRNGVLRTLLGLTDEVNALPKNPSFIFSQDLSPSDCLSLPKKMIKGFCTVEGGTTSHTAILSRSLGVPALVGIPQEVLNLPEGEQVVVDGYRGEIITEPDQESVTRYLALRDAKKKALAAAMAEAHEAAISNDGHPILVCSNIGSDSDDDLVQAVENGAEGVGLLRTEFIYLDCDKMPDEEYQYKKYSAVLSAFGDRPVILRTLDIGGDKQLPYLELPYELNPFLGVRGLRLCLRNVDLFKTQLRAALRAGVHGNLRIMFPMVTKASEVAQARAIIAECCQEMDAAGIAYAKKVDIGIMIEIPAAAILSEHLAQEVDFFSIGTNDLSQYTMAVDRTNTTLANLANAFDPSVLTLISMVVQAAHKYGKDVGVCGELAGDPLAVPILLGLGLDELSMNTPVVPVVKQIVRSLSYAESQALAQEVLKMETLADVKKYVIEKLPFLQDIG